MTATLYEAALAYSRRGWPVLPLKPRDKVPATRHGLLDATTSVRQITSWWLAWPESNIGLRTGCGFDVLDIDGPTGQDSMAELQPGYRHNGPTAATGKGWHLLFDVTGARNATAMRPGLDYRGQNGYIVAPPSVHPNGHQYAWARPPDLALPIAPQWLEDLLSPPSTRSGSRRPLDDFPELLDLATELHKLGVVLQDRGAQLMGCCPFHPDRNPSLSVYDDGKFFCHGCRAWGDAQNVRRFAETGALR